jgi:alpha-1,2-mannosyltransferase
MRAENRNALVLVGLLGAAAAVSLVSVYKVLTGHPEQVAIDLPSYIEGARRLVETGSPYSVELHAGPLENIASNIDVGYFYPPPLAQLFVPLILVPSELLTWAWVLCPAILLAVLLPVVHRRFGGSEDRGVVVGVLLAAVAFTPNLVAVYIGNVSGWIAILVALLLIVQVPGRAATAVAAMWLKLTPGVFALGAFVDRSTRVATVGASLAIFVVSLVLAPAAWRDWVDVLPAIAGLSEAPYTSNLAPSHVFASTGIPALAGISRVAVPVLFGIMLVVSARKGNIGAWVAAAAGVYLTASDTAWDHYFAVLSPIAAAAWPLATRLRYLIVGVLAWYGPLRFLETQAWYQLLGLVLWLAFLFGAIVVFRGLATLPRASILARLSPRFGSPD